jgi:hypothetical protein
MVLSDTAAVDLVKGEDHVAPRAIAADLSSRAVHERGIVLSSNVEVTVHARRVAGHTRRRSVRVCRCIAPDRLPTRLVQSFSPPHGQARVLGLPSARPR